ncbi:MAG TPA: MFS transporter, partial [Phycicoccus sp.]
VSLLVGAVLIGLTSYIPTFAQGVLGSGALLSGFALAAMTIGWPIAAATSGRLYLRLGFRTTMIIGAVVALAGAGLLLTVDEHSSVLHLAAPCFVLGLGFGYVTSPSVVAAQSAVPWRQRGVATGATIFGRSLGSAVGVAAFGAIANSVVRSRTGGEPGNLESLPPDVLGPAIDAVFLAAAIATVALLLAALVMPRKVDEVPDDDVLPATT